MHPTLRTMILFACLIPLGIGVALAPSWFSILWLAWFVACLLLPAIDGILCPRPSQLEIEFDAPPELLVGRRESLVVRLHDPRDRSYPVRCRLEVEGELGVIPEFAVELLGADDRVIEVDLLASRRGRASVVEAWTGTKGPLGFMAVFGKRPVSIELPVVPDVKRAKDEALAFLASPTFEVTEQRSRFLGGGSEFHALREFFAGADTRLIDWKSSARHRKILMREFHEERNHQVVLALDCGRLMCEPLDGVPRIDRAAAAALALGVVALRGGDRVGFYAFDSRPRSYVEASGGKRAWHRLRQAVAGIEYASVESNFTLAITELSGRLKRRSVVVVLTDFVDTVTAELMTDHLSRLARKHVVLFVALRDPLLEELRDAGNGTDADAPPPTLIDIARATVADDLVRDREIVLRTLQSAGVHCIDTHWSQISARLLNLYVAIRRRELVG